MAGNIFLYAVLLVASLLAGYTDAAALNPVNFTHAAHIQGDTAKGSLYHVALTGNLLQHCSRNCGDMRLFDTEGREVPYVVLETRIDQGRESHEVKLINFKEEATGAVLYMEMPEKYDRINNITIDTPNRDFRIDVELFGSDDQKNWASVVSDVIYDFSAHVDLRKTGFRVPALRYKFLMLKMSYAARKGTGEEINLKYNGLDFSVSDPGMKNIRINRVYAEVLPEGGADPIYDELRVPDFKMEQGKKNETIVTVNTGLPLQRIYLDISNPYYFRKVTVYWDEKGKEFSREAGRGAIYRFPLGNKQETKNYIDLASYGRGFYRIVIENGGNPPPYIQGIRISWIKKQLFFVALADAGHYTLSVGSNLVDAQNYDLLQFVNSQNWNRLNSMPLNISPAVQTSGYTPAATADKKAVLEKKVLLSVVALLVAAMGFWLYLLLKKISKKAS